jgi:hypothetical protein
MWYDRECKSGVFARWFDAKTGTSGRMGKRERRRAVSRCCKVSHKIVNFVSFFLWLDRKVLELKRDRRLW